MERCMNLGQIVNCDWNEWIKLPHPTVKPLTRDKRTNPAKNKCFECKKKFLFVFGTVFLTTL